MRRSVPLLACVLLLLGSAMASALTRADLDRVVDVSVTLKTLSMAAKGEVPLPTGRLIMITGTVSDVNILDKDQASFKVRVELIMGEWIGTEDVKAYTCYVDFSGPEYFSVFPARAPKESTSEMVLSNSRVLIVGRVAEVVTTPQGQKQVRVEGVYIRPIE